METHRRFDLIETMRFDPHDGVVDLDRHLARMKASADALDFPFDRHEARNELQAATFRAGPSKVRLLLSRSGALAIEMRPLRAARRTSRSTVAVAPLPVPAERFPPRATRPATAAFLRRGAARPPGAFEVLFRDAEGFLTEGSFTSLFVERGGTAGDAAARRAGCSPACCARG